MTKPWRLTLSDGRMTHDAAFQSIERRKLVARVGRRTELKFAGSYHFNIAAYRLARLLGLTDMVPPSVERRWNRRLGALTWWIDAAWDESDRKAQQLRPPDIQAWSAQLYRMVVFSEPTPPRAADRYWSGCPRRTAAREVKGIRVYRI